MSRLQAIKMKKYILLICIWLFNLLPIKKNKIFFLSYYGSQYGCNPKYISQYIQKHKKNDFDIVWGFNDLSGKEHLSGIRMVKMMSIKYLFELSTSKVIITNFRTTEFFIKRKHQFYIQTWHSSLRLKQIEKDAEANLPSSYIKMAKKDSQKIDLLISGCQLSTSIFRRSFWYDGEILEQGTPRNDAFFLNTEDTKANVQNELNISSDTRIVLYAPTFRKNHSLQAYNIDYQAVLDKLNEKFGGEWIFLVKLHPHLHELSQQLLGNSHVKNVTGYHDTQELLMASDILISDYSSLIFDYAITRRPCFLYIPDQEEYTANDRKLYFSLNDLPFVTALNNEEMLNRIHFFDEKTYQETLAAFMEWTGTFEDGRACESLVNIITKVCGS
ncbi:CDP-glycerol glycerophosphotransferase family protein [Heyndrickxia acidicola]|uniref:CDP-glycerol glycerophosphotransferase family protein n=1 Tax=Heyndrickxia acidicola TaxID=209389 RepID=A0ABU6ML02_9BACI|nr:CDP-glycerol glycerophosphotransferase family protein [Heyndrickxia acidicola]MED1205205.1 CDP-glycerol glycerophosphotransferase family protein [Heyndrickxia acidicola]